MKARNIFQDGEKKPAGLSHIRFTENVNRHSIGISAVHPCERSRLINERFFRKNSHPRALYRDKIEKQNFFDGILFVINATDSFGRIKISHKSGILQLDAKR